MSSAFSLHSLPEYREDQQIRSLLSDILNDAVRNRQLYPSACNLLAFSQHHHRHQQQFTVQTEAGALFLKCQDERDQERYVAEEKGLLSLMATQTIAVCAPLAKGVVRTDSNSPMAYLILQHIPLAVHGDWFSAGQQLAQMHSHTTDKGYGFDCATWCGETEQDNRWNTSWTDFFISQRLQPLFDHLSILGVHFSQQQEALYKARQRLQHYQPAAALLHGDLWSGNIGFNPDRQLSYPVLFDPACYYGDAETDLAMTELFGRFPKKFYDGYQSVQTISGDYQQRKPVYQLYHVLNHALLYGGSYISQADEMIRQL